MMFPVSARQPEMRSLGKPTMWMATLAVIGARLAANEILPLWSYCFLAIGGSSWHCRMMEATPVRSNSGTFQDLFRCC